METDTATAGSPRTSGDTAPSERREPLGVPTAGALEQVQSMPKLPHCVRLYPYARHMSQVWAEQSSPKLWHREIECVTAMHLSHLVPPAAAQPAVGAAVGAADVPARGTGRAVGVRAC